MPSKLSLLMQIVTAPTNLVQAQAHIAGWSESFWNSLPMSSLVDIQALAVKRAVLLPTTGRLVGYRQQTYTIQGNQLVPGGTNSGSLGYPGSLNRPCDVPQMALMLKASALTGPNTRTFTVRGIPDEQTDGGEWQPSAPYLALMTQYRNHLATAGWFFPGRDLSKPSVRVLSIINGVIKTDAPLAGAVIGNFVRLLKVRDVNGKAVKGTFNITAIDLLTNSYTVANLAATCLNVGRVRIDAISIIRMEAVEVQRVVVKKVGGPFERYRGRRSKQR